MSGHEYGDLPVSTGDVADAQPADALGTEITPETSDVPVVVQAAGVVATESAAQWRPEERERAHRLMTNTDVRRGVELIARKHQHPDPDGLLIETIVKLAGAPSFDFDTNVGGFAYRTAQRIAINDFRARMSRPRTVPLEMLEWSHPNLAAPDNTQVVEQRLLLKELLGVLNGKQKKVIETVCVQGMSIDEAAEVLGLGAGAVRTHLHRARKKMKKYALEHDLMPW